MNPELRLVLGPADVRDQRWLDERIVAIDDGIDAVLDIAANWSDGRNLARLYPDSSAQAYIIEHVKHPLGRGVVVPLLENSNWSNRQIAAVAGVHEATVRRTASSAAVARPTKTLGADRKLRSKASDRAQPTTSDGETVVVLAAESPYWSALRTLLGELRDLDQVSSDVLAANVPSRRRASVARDLRKFGRTLGAIAARLEEPT